jgi:hypothetical protein
MHTAYSQHQVGMLNGLAIQTKLQRARLVSIHVVLTYSGGWFSQTRGVPVVPPLLRNVTVLCA